MTSIDWNVGMPGTRSPRLSARITFRVRMARVCVLIAGALLSTTFAAAQTAAVLQGTVFDPSGAVVPGAAVHAQHNATGIEREALTDNGGQYQIVALTAGEYRIEVRTSGFNPHVLERLVIDGGRTIVHDVHLRIGDVAEDVVVSARTSPIDRATIAVGHVMDEQFVHQMPLNGRRFVDLGFLLPGSVTPPQGGFLTAPSRGDGFYSFNTAGNREDAVNFMVNGISVNEQFNDLTMLTSIQTVQEMKVDNSTFSAQYGRNSGAIVNIVTRSGTNQLRGELFEFLRDESLDARNFFSIRPEPEPFSRHQFGVSVGGPMVTNRLFFYGAYEGVRQRQNIDLNSLVLSDAERASVRVPEVQQLLQYIPRANVVDARGTSRFVGSGTAPFNSDQAAVDISFVPSGNRNLHAYYWHMRDRRNEPVLQGNTIPGFGDIRQRRRHIFTLSETRVVNPTVVNEARFGFTRNLGIASPALLVNPAMLGIQLGVDEVIGLPQISIGGGLNFGGPANFLMRREGTTFAVSDTLSYRRARHSIRMGGEFRWYRNESSIKDPGRFNFPSVADFVAGTANSFSVTLGDRQANISQDALSFFAQDQFGLRPNLTLEVGLRYDWNMTPTERDDRFVVFDEATASLVRVGSQIDKIYEENDDNFQPRVGVIWDLLGDGGLTLRAAYGVYVNQPITNVVAGAVANPPLVTPLSVSGPVRLDNAIRLARAAGLAPTTVDPGFTNATTQSWNANVQREVMRNVALMVGYFGSRGTDLRISTNINQPINGVRPFPALSQSSPILPGAALGNIMQFESSGRSNYHGLWISSHGRVSDALQVTASYTLAKSTDYNSLNTQGIIIQNSYDLPGELGPSDYDARHRGVVTAIYRLPFRGNQLVDGWQIAAIVQAQSGSPVNIVTSNSTVNGVANTLRPDVTGPIRILGRVDQWFDTSVFVAANHFGNLGRNAVVGPAYRNTDLSVSKTTALASTRVEVRAEVFNLFNHANLGQPGPIVGSPNFGVITSTRYPTGELASSRQIQFSATVTF